MFIFMKICKNCSLFANFASVLLFFYQFYKVRAHFRLFFRL